MEEYAEYQLHRASRRAFGRQLRGARTAAEARYPGKDKPSLGEVWPSTYSAFEVAAWPERFHQGRFSREALIAGLRALTPPQPRDEFLNYQSGDPLNLPLVDGYENSRSNSTDPRTYIYWQVLRSGFVYQRAMNDQKHLLGNLLALYLVRTIDTLIRWYTLTELRSETVTARFQVSNTSGLTTVVPGVIQVGHACNLPELICELEKPRDQWRESNRAELTREVLRELMQQSGIADPPMAGLSAAIEQAIAARNREQPTGQSLSR